MSLQQATLAVCFALFSFALSAQKLVTIGDSQTANCGWQPSVAEQTGYEWSREETTIGADNHRPMAVGGTWMRPNNESSIVLRGRDAEFYHPDKIIIYTGQNDNRHYWLSNDNTGTSAIEKVQQEEAYNGDTINTEITSLAAFKGLIEYLQKQCPESQLYLMTHVPVLCVIGMNPDDYFSQYYPSPRFPDIDAVIAFEQRERVPKDELIRAMGEYYDLPVIDLWKYSGITYYNTEQYYGAPAGDCTQVHLNQAGELLIAECIADYLLNAPLRYDSSWIPATAASIDENRVSTPTLMYNALGQPLPAGSSSGIAIINGEKIFR